MKYLIWNFERGMWWKPDNHGYTSDITEAGRYPFSWAQSIVDKANLLLKSDKLKIPEEAIVPDPFYSKNLVMPKDLTLQRTCHACPEQYNVYYKEEVIGYLRLRHGYFRADYPDAAGETIYYAFPEGDGIFANEKERKHYIDKALTAICRKLNYEQN